MIHFQTSCSYKISIQLPSTLLARSLTVLRVPFTWINFPSAEMNLERSLRMQSSKSTVLPLPVGAEITMFTSDRKQAEKHSL